MKNNTRAAATIGISLGLMLVGHSQVFAAPIVWPVSIGGNGHFYEIIAVDEGINWLDAKAAAEASGGYLVTILSEAENQFVFDNLVNNPVYWIFGFAPPFQNEAAGPWIGAFQPSDSPEPAGGWQWVHNDGLLSDTYSNWLPGEPNNFAGGEEAALFFDNNLVDPPTITAKWNDWPDDLTTLSYIVEFDAGPGPSPIPAPSSLILLSSGLALLSQVGWAKAKRCPPINA